MTQGRPGPEAKKSRAAKGPAGGKGRNGTRLVSRGTENGCEPGTGTDAGMLYRRTRNHCTGV